jgi:predicted DNA-binding transcriptional regulator YafY
MKRINIIIEHLYKSPQSKPLLAKSLGVSEKTIENTIKAYNESKSEIVYDKKIAKYRFDTLLPRVIPYAVLLAYMKDNINNHILREDFIEVLENVEVLSSSCDEALIEIYRLSPLFKNIIKIKMAFVINAILKIKYIGLKGVEETKYIRPHALNHTGYSYYLYASYDEKNGVDAGKYRSFALSGIKSIELEECTKESLYTGVKCNAWGKYEKNIMLSMRADAAGFFKREQIVNSDVYELLSVEHDGSILVKMSYNKEDEIVQLLQRWMPYIMIDKKSDISERVYAKIKENFVQWSIQDIS